MKSTILRRNGRAQRNLALSGLTLVALCLTVVCTLNLGLGNASSRFARVPLLVDAAPSPADGSGGLSSYFSSARNLLATSLDAHNQARVYSSLMPNEDPRTAQMLRDTIDKTSNLIQAYQHDGLSNMPPLPSVPGLNVLMRLPDKLLRAELSMLQDGIRMAQEMRERPLTATMNTPRELTTMFARMAQQLSM